MGGVLGIEKAINIGIKEGGLIRPFATTKGIVQTMMAFDAMSLEQSRAGKQGPMNVPSLRVEFVKEVGGKALMWALGGASTEAVGIDALNGDINDMIFDVEDAAQDLAAELGWTYLQSKPIGIRQADIDRLKNNPTDLMDFVKNKTWQLGEGFVKKIQNDFLPKTTAVATTGGATGAASATRLQSLHYGLSTGQQHNGTGTATGFEYCGIEMGTANTDLRAIQWSDENSAAVAFNMAGLRNNILRPLNSRGWYPDLMLGNAVGYTGFQTLIESDFLFGSVKKLDYGVETIMVEGLYLVYEPRLDNFLNSSGTAINKLIVGCSESLNIRFADKSGTGNDILNGTFKVRELERTVHAGYMQGGATAAIALKHPFKWGQANSLSFPTS